MPADWPTPTEPAMESRSSWERALTRTCSAAWAVTGKLLGLALSLSVPTEAGRRAGGAIGRWGAWLLPALHLLLLLSGGSGNAGHGFRVLGSEGLFSLLCLPWYAAPGLGCYALAAYVVRDLARGLRSGRP